jgi:adenosylcobinamide-phosphate synthase
MSFLALRPPASLIVAGGALLLEACLGYPDALFGAIGHPVMWIGAVIDRLEHALNHPAWTAGKRRIAGGAALVVLLAGVIVPALLLQGLILRIMPRPLALALLALLATPLLAQRSLYQHVAAVAAGLHTAGLAGGRSAVAHIVGRNPASLDEAGVVRAVIESLAENFSDGVVAPAVWAAIGGLPGIAAYKAVNTADSMIGHLTERHAAFGWAAARFDDLVNLPASRLAALWLVLAACVHPAASGRQALRATLRDSRHHRSPNAGWPEAAMAGALSLRLAGPRIYGQTEVDDAWMGDGRSDATVADLARALTLYCMACGMQIAAVIVLLSSI